MGGEMGLKEKVLTSAVLNILTVEYVGSASVELRHGCWTGKCWTAVCFGRDECEYRGGEYGEVV
jgi:hypothetical protein